MDFLILVTLVLIVILALIPYLRKFKSENEFRKIFNRIPGPIQFPIIGTMWCYIKHKREDRFNVGIALNKQYKEFGLFRMWVGNSFPELRVFRCEFLEEIWRSSKHIEKSPTYDLVKPMLGEGLITSKGQRWFKHRRLITPTFHFSILENFCEVFSENANVLVDSLNSSCETDSEINIYPPVTKTALDIICETAMGIKLDPKQKSNQEYIKALGDFTESALQRFFKPWLLSDFIFKRSRYAATYEKSLNMLQSFTKKVIHERKLGRQMTKENNEKSTNDINDVGIKKRQAFLDLLLDANENENQLLSDDDILHEVNTFMFAGHDTTSVGICWALFMIGLHDNIQEKIYAEMEEIFGSSKRGATYRDLNEMKYLERVIKETLRIYPSVPSVSRKISEDLEIGGYKVPKGSFVRLEIYFIHRDERYFKDPETFDPDRFLPENVEGRHSYAFVPFAAGPRNCIGQRFALLEEKSIISAIVRNFKIKSLQKRSDIKLIQELVLRPLDGIKVHLEKR